jgi:hypothetical protein
LLSEQPFVSSFRHQPFIFMSQAKYSCPICKQQAPDLKSMEQHHESKASTPCRVTVQRHSHPQQHAKLCAFDPEACVNMHEVHGGTTQGFLHKTSPPPSNIVLPFLCSPPLAPAFDIQPQVSLFVAAQSCE